MPNPFSIAADEAKKRALQMMSGGLPANDPEAFRASPAVQAADNIGGGLAMGMPISQAVTNAADTLSDPIGTIQKREAEYSALPQEAKVKALADMVMAGSVNSGVKNEFQHILRKGTDVGKLLKEGFQSGIGPNVMRRWEGKPENIMQMKYAPREGDQILYVPEEWVIETGNGPKIKSGFKPTLDNITEYKTKQLPLAAESEQLRASGVNQYEAAFYDKSKDQVIKTGAIHDLGKLSSKQAKKIIQAEENNIANMSREVSDGFVDKKTGKFLYREELQHILDKAAK